MYALQRIHRHFSYCLAVQVDLFTVKDDLFLSATTNHQRRMTVTDLQGMGIGLIRSQEINALLTPS